MKNANDEIIFGASLLEILTIGMYRDSRSIYRAYIQNSCDQIDKAVKLGLLLNRSDGHIDISVNKTTRTVTITDNATGIPATEFKNTLYNIANSAKIVGENKGFRGIDRLCGLAYCKELTFTSKAAGEDVMCIMKSNAAKLRELLDAHMRGERHTAGEVWSAINEFSTVKAPSRDEHWFMVELRGVSDDYAELLDVDSVKEYLSFLAPVPYDEKFSFRTAIHDYANEYDHRIDEYDIRLNDTPILKPYKAIFPTGKGDDEIFDLAFQEFRDAQGNLLAWLWIGLSCFKAGIPKSCTMRGLRLRRKNNIQVGDQDVLQKLFKEDRGPCYFIGEVFTIADDLVPNARGDYFIENATRHKLENMLRSYFKDTLHVIYYKGCDINSSYDKLAKFQQAKAEFKEKERSGVFTDRERYDRALAILTQAENNAKKADDTLGKLRAQYSTNKILKKVITHIELLYS